MYCPRNSEHAGRKTTDPPPGHYSPALWEGRRSDACQSGYRPKRFQPAHPQAGVREALAGTPGPTNSSLMHNLISPLGKAAGVRLPARFGMAAVALAASSLAPTAAAQEARLAETVVTATRTETKLDETLADVRVITREQIEAVGPGRSVAEVLQRLAGVQLSSYGGRGHAQSVFLRGAGSSHALLLVDGVRYGSATTAAPVLANLPLELIERIEVVKGPASALYGSEAVGGVIQVFTKRGQGAGKPFLGNAEVTLGDYGHKSGVVGLRGEQNGFDYQLNLSRVTEHGISATNADDGGYDPDRDAFDQTAAQVAVGYAFNADWRVQAQWMQSRGTVFLDSGPGSHDDLRTEVGRIQLQGQVLPRWRSTVSVGESTDKQIGLKQSWGDYHFTTRQTEYKWDNTITTPLGVVLAGVERLEQKVDTSNAYAVNKRTVDAVFAGLNGNAGRHSWQINVRNDDNSQFGDFTTYGLSYGLELVQGLRAYAAHGKSMRAPSFNDLYYPAPGMSWGGNPDLVPEKGKNNEIGLQWSQGAHSAKLLHFDNKIQNLIASGSTSMANVAGTTRLKGWSVEYGFALQGWAVAATYDYLDAKQADGQTPVRRAKHQASLNVDKQLGAWRLGTSLLHVGSRKDTDFKPWPSVPVTLPAYTTADVYAEYQFTPEWSLQARIANLGNVRYETAYGYNQLGRAGYLTLKWAMR